MIEITNTWDAACNMCMAILENLSHMTGLSYGFINILLFVILEPLAISLFTVSATIYLPTQTTSTARGLRQAYSL